MLPSFLQWVEENKLPMPTTSEANSALRNGFGSQYPAGYKASQYQDLDRKSIGYEMASAGTTIAYNPGVNKKL